MKNEFKPDVDVLMRLAEAFFENNSMKKTHVYFASRISWISFERYLNWLITKNYVEPVLDGTEGEYRLTNEGREMFFILKKFKDYIKSHKSSSVLYH
ncbi:MAG TPA: winged helix-turn-helix domain-containing protein [Candidatus Bathyarchaeia archaeon]|nr:winged helix-turn-helix domain-containing protein [Candidatus Bathyarchaeia archaeon]